MQRRQKAGWERPTLFWDETEPWEREGAEGGGGRGRRGEDRRGKQGPGLDGILIDDGRARESVALHALYCVDDGGRGLHTLRGVRGGRMRGSAGNSDLQSDDF